MPWTGQVIHVMRKDVRQLRSFLLLYVAAVAAAMVHILRSREGWSIFAETVVLLVFVLGMLVVAALIQADSPTRKDAFWAMRPMSPSAVFAAKIATTAIVVIGLGLAAQAIVLLVLAVPMRIGVPLLANSLRIYSLWLVVAMMIATPTRDLRTFIIVLTALLFALMVGLLAWITATVDFQTAAARVLFATVGLVGGLAFVLHFYRVRDAKRETLVLGLAPVLAIWLHLVSMTPSDTPTGVSSITPAVTIGFALQVRPGPTSTMLDTRFTLTGAKPGEAYVLQDASFLVYAAGAVTRIPIPQRLTLASNGVTGLTSGTNVHLPAVMDSVELTGRWSHEVEDVVHILPMRLDASTTQDGRRLSLSSMSSLGADFQFAVRTRFVEDGFNPGTGTGTGDRFAAIVLLVNEEHHESLPVNIVNSVSTSKVVILPGIMLREITDHYKVGLVRSPNRGHELDAAWLRGAHLEISRLIPKGAFPARSTYVVPK